mmetsp:Transcript_15660/g.19096  ORF Transcript_15660/g.19096 Transcript_15660/m.19096 type:complete len:219 (+) Transcript_15660:190-846(+)
MSSEKDAVATITGDHDLQALKKEAENTSLKLESITDGVNENGVPKVRFVEDITSFTNSFNPPASAELMIGAYSDLFGKFKTYEGSLAQKKQTFNAKIPEIEKSLKLVKFLKAKQDDDETLTTRYNLADMIFARAEISASGIVHLWLGANVMLEYTYDEAIELLSTKLEKAKKDLEVISENLSFVRNQIITSEVNISRIYNWDVRKKRQERMEADANKE